MLLKPTTAHVKRNNQELYVRLSRRGTVDSRDGAVITTQGPAQASSTTVTP